MHLHVRLVLWAEHLEEAIDLRLLILGLHVGHTGSIATDFLVSIHHFALKGSSLKMVIIYVTVPINFDPFSVQFRSLKASKLCDFLRPGVLDIQADFLAIKVLEHLEFPEDNELAQV